MRFGYFFIQEIVDGFELNSTYASSTTTMPENFCINVSKAFKSKLFAVGLLGVGTNIILLVFVTDSNIAETSNSNEVVRGTSLIPTPFNLAATLYIPKVGGKITISS